MLCALLGAGRCSGCCGSTARVWVQILAAANDSPLPVRGSSWLSRWELCGDCCRSSGCWKLRLPRQVPRREQLRARPRGQGTSFLWKHRPRPEWTRGRVSALLWAQVMLHSFKTDWHCSFWTFLWFVWAWRKCLAEMLKLCKYSPRSKKIYVVEVLFASWGWGYFCLWLPSLKELFPIALERCSF